MSTSGPAHRVQSAVVEYGYPNGHLGHLTSEEEEAFKNFKLLCAEKGTYKPADGERPASHDDATLLRFLRARRFIVIDAYTQFSETEAWRKANHLEQLYETIDLEHYDETRRLYPQWTGRRDRRGIPLYVFEVKHLNSKTMSAYEKSAKETHSKAQTDGKTPPKLLRLFALYENLVRFVMPLCTALTDRDHPRTPITQSNNIVDISGVGLKQFWNLRGHMQDASTLATAHYPETLDRIFIIGAPAFFPTVWGWIKKWFDPITTSKIFIISQSDMKKTLESFIDPTNIPKKYGGLLDFEFGDTPRLDPQLDSVLEWKSDNKDFPTGPMYWVNEVGHKETGDLEAKKIKAIAVGTFTEGKKERQEEVCVVTTTYSSAESAGAVNGHALGPEKSVTENGLLAPARPDLMSMKTGVEDEDTQPPTPDLTHTEPNTANPNVSVPSMTISSPTDTQHTTPQTQPQTTTETGKETGVAVQNGEIIPASRPEPVSFVTATEGLTLNEKTENINAANGTGGPHSSVTANLLDPKLQTS